MTIRVQVVFYSMYGHIYELAKAVAEGAGELHDTEVALFQVPELVPQEVLEQTGAAQARAAFSHVPVIQPEDMADAHAIIFGTPTRFGNMCAQMRNFLDQTGKLWMEGALIGKVASVFTSTASQHGGQETTLTSFHSTLLHHGMIIVGVPYAEARLTGMGAISGGTPYGASTITGGDGSRRPSEDELHIARYQGRHAAGVAKKVFEHGHGWPHPNPGLAPTP